MYWFCREGLGCSVCTRPLQAFIQVETKVGGLSLAWIDFLHLFRVSCFQIGGQIWVLFLTFASLYTIFCEVVYNGLLSGSVSTLDMKSVQSFVIGYDGTQNTFQVFPTSFGLSIICSVFFHSLATRVGLWHVWKQSCCASPIGHLRPRHIFCEVAGTMMTLAAPPLTSSSYCCQFLAVL